MLKEWCCGNEQALRQVCCDGERRWKLAKVGRKAALYTTANVASLSGAKVVTGPTAVKDAIVTVQSAFARH